MLGNENEALVVAGPRASSTALFVRRLGRCSVPFFVLAILVVLLALVVITAVAYLVARRW